MRKRKRKNVSLINFSRQKSGQPRMKKASIIIKANVEEVADKDGSWQWMKLEF